ncbi:hypothetical protein SR882_04615 [Guyparkeria halophila]|uniref:DUF4386 family protein n=1 Tax=Guyparkeria halophila TaxID=47960 RepID=A0ABZ0YYC2_9GAMM|nr:hypothetical protein [Guyparkeria halophila]WQH17191.1 hypothetical protein SR882_04615 [Guyparkeria halophila]
MIQILLSVVGAAAGIVSMVSLYFWLVFANGVVTGDGGMVSFTQTVAPHMYESLSSSQKLLIHARDYFIVIGGAIGWLSFFALFAMTARPWNRLPRVVIGGCVVGVVAAAVTAMPIHAMSMVFAMPPVLAVSALLLRAYLAVPDAERGRILL